jgi:hypothetical protein
MRYWDIPCMKKGGGWVLTQGQPLVSLEEGVWLGRRAVRAG